MYIGNNGQFWPQAIQLLKNRLIIFFSNQFPSKWIFSATVCKIKSIHEKLYEEIHINSYFPSNLWINIEIRSWNYLKSLFSLFPSFYSTLWMYVVYVLIYQSNCSKFSAVGIGDGFNFKICFLQCVSWIVFCLTEKRTTSDCHLESIASLTMLAT